MFGALYVAYEKMSEYFLHSYKYVTYNTMIIYQNNMIEL